MKKTIVTIVVIFSSHFIIAQEYRTVTDIDGNVYQTVQIGDQFWMAENLKVTHYQNGDEIPTALNKDDWVNLTSGAYAVYGDDYLNTEIIDMWGNLYNWYVVNDERGICPIAPKIPFNANSLLPL